MGHRHMDDEDVKSNLVGRSGTGVVIPVHICRWLKCHLFGWHDWRGLLECRVCSISVWRRKGIEVDDPKERDSAIGNSITPNQDLLTVPDWMEPYRTYFVDTGGNMIELLINDKTPVMINAVLAVMSHSAYAQYWLLQRLYADGLLTGKESK